MVIHLRAMSRFNCQNALLRGDEINNTKSKQCVRWIENLAVVHDGRRRVFHQIEISVQLLSSKDLRRRTNFPLIVCRASFSQRAKSTAKPMNKIPRSVRMMSEYSRKFICRYIRIGSSTECIHPSVVRQRMELFRCPLSTRNASLSSAQPSHTSRPTNISSFCFVATVASGLVMRWMENRWFRRRQKIVMFHFSNVNMAKVDDGRQFTYIHCSETLWPRR